MGKFYARGDLEAPEGVGINLTDTSRVFLFMWRGEEYVSIALDAPEARALARELIAGAERIEEDART